MLTLTHDLVCVVDADRRFVDVNPAWERCLGWRSDELVGHHADEFVHPDDRERTEVEGARVRSDGAGVSGFTNRYRCKDGSYRWLSWNAHPRSDGSIYAVGRDVTDRKQRHFPRPLSAEFYRQLVESSEDAIITKDRDAIITSWNEAAERMYGYSAEEAVGRPVSILIPPEHRGEEFELLNSVLSGEPIDHHETERVTKSGRRLDVSLSVSAIRDKAGKALGAAVIARDITERKRMERRLTFLAQHDPLTGLFNRRRFEEEVERGLRQAQRYGRPGAVLAIDLDDLKIINDTWGHAAGDMVLQRVASALSEHTRDADVVARMGGDEFAVLLMELEPYQAVGVARKLLQDIACRWEGRVVEASIGIAPFDSTGNVAAGDLLVAADSALYEAKEAGGNLVARHRSQRSASLGWVSRIRHALDEDRLRLEAQPIVDVRTGEVSHEELLVRMVDEHGEWLPPSSFLPTAERFGLIQELDRWVIDRAVELAGEGRRVAVNLSARSIGDQDVISRIARRIEETGVDPRNLQFEITETAAVLDMTHAHRSAQFLTDLGCSFALDDFGTGFAPLSYLKRLPLKYLKIDGEFIRDLATDRGDGHVVEAVVALARGFDTLTIAECVESEATLQALPEYGVDYAQGFYLGRPGPLEDGPRPSHPVATG